MYVRPNRNRSSIKDEIAAILGDMEIGDERTFPPMRRAQAQSVVYYFNKQKAKEFMTKMYSDALSIWRVK